MSQFSGPPNAEHAFKQPGFSPNVRAFQGLRVKESGQRAEKKVRERELKLHISKAIKGQT